MISWEETLHASLQYNLLSLLLCTAMWAEERKPKLRKHFFLYLFFFLFKKEPFIRRRKNKRDKKLANLTAKSSVALFSKRGNRMKETRVRTRKTFSTSRTFLIRSKLFKAKWNIKSKLERVNIKKFCFSCHKIA